jgi:hypothetical protein
MEKYAVVAGSAGLHRSGKWSKWPNAFFLKMRYTYFYAHWPVRKCVRTGS